VSVVAVAEVALGERTRPTEALGDVLAGLFQVYATVVDAAIARLRLL
jgi:hypothetical protein